MKLTLVDIKTRSELWSEYTLADGTVMRVRPSCSAFRRTDQFDQEGKPVYMQQSMVEFEVLPPPELMQGYEAKRDS